MPTINGTVSGRKYLNIAGNPPGDKGIRIFCEIMCRMKLYFLPDVSLYIRIK